jgi:hypothetical protein
MGQIHAKLIETGQVTPIGSKGSATARVVEGSRNTDRKPAGMYDGIQGWNEGLPRLEMKGQII